MTYMERIMGVFSLQLEIEILQFAQQVILGSSEQNYVASLHTLALPLSPVDCLVSPFAFRTQCLCNNELR